MSRQRNPELKRKKILDAALKILRDGAFLTKFSLDSVAQEAGVSKGGLIHHFGSKEALLTAVAEQVTADFEQRVLDYMAQEAEGTPGRLLRSYIRVVLSDEGEAQADVSPVLLSYIKKADARGSRFDYWRERMAHDGLDEVTATKVRLTVDGLLYTEMIDGQAIDRHLRRKIFEQLLQEIAHQPPEKKTPPK